MFRSIPGPSWVLILLSALVQVVIFPVSGPVSAIWSSLSWIALVPFLVALVRPSRNSAALSVAQSGVLGYCCGIAWYLGNCSWIFQTMYLYGGMPKPVAFGILFLFSMYLGLYHALFAAIFSALRRSKLGAAGALLLSPFVWVAVELARERVTGFPWDLLGYSQVDNAWITRLAPVAGVMSLSFIVASVNAGVASFFLGKGKRRPWIAAVALVLAVIVQIGTVAGARSSGSATDQAAVMVQENLAVGEAAREVEPIPPGNELSLFSALSRNPHEYGPKKALPTVIIWPEAPSHFFSIDASFRASLAQLARSLHAPAIIGTLGLDLAHTVPERYLEYDSAALFNANGDYEGRYDKVHLVPWGEYIPFKQFFGFAHKLTEGAGDMQPGRNRSVFAANGHRYGTFICYESVFGDEVREFVLNGADVLVNISNDGWYGDTGAPWQHLNMTRMRAIENNRWLLLDTNTGVTTAIDPYGRMQAQAPRHVRGGYEFPFAFVSTTTFYTRHGDWFAWLCVGITLVACALCLTRVSASKSNEDPGY